MNDIGWFEITRRKSIGGEKGKSLRYEQMRERNARAELKPRIRER